MSVSVLFAGGGSGGHVFPLLAVAEALRAASRDVEITFVGTRTGMEATLLPARGERLELLEVLPIKGMGVGGAARGVAQAFRTLPAARDLIRRLSPDVVMSVGGYAAGPVSLAARAMGVPLTLLEPNSVLGMANLLLTPLVKRAYLVFPGVERRFRPSVVRRFGLPLRPGFSPQAYEPREGRASLLVLGGSQGAKALNEALPEAIARVAKIVPHVRVLHQTGKGSGPEVRERYAALGLGDLVEVVPFLEDMPARIAAADVVVGRAGAGALSEICAIGRAAIYVPYPFAAADHQRLNAEALAEAGAAVSVVQREASAERLAQELLSLLLSPDRRAAMADAARAQGAGDAAAKVAADLLSIAQSSSARKHSGGLRAAQAAGMGA
jgi:UDP-N-acetylglucosamine--N-acetylmuramyl-(pentapeptide) pyrophosphoryl-undecaprenol N-acetylglucosamine transferase